LDPHVADADGGGQDVGVLFEQRCRVADRQLHEEPLTGRAAADLADHRAAAIWRGQAGERHGAVPPAAKPRDVQAPQQPAPGPGGREHRHEGDDHQGAPGRASDELGARDEQRRQRGGHDDLEPQRPQRLDCGDEQLFEGFGL
jgi:hypothetical protein